MAVRTTSPRQGTAKISGATSYASVISRYASQIQNALQSELEAERQAVILAYKAGSMSWNDVKAFFEQKILGSPEGSMDRVKYQQDLVDLQGVETERVKNNKRAELEAKYAEGGTTPKERYDIESEMLRYETPGTDNYVAQQQKVITSYENAETQRLMQIKEKLIAQYAEGGITPQEELSINQALKAEANPDTQIYNTLVNEEQSIRERLDTYLKGQGQQNLTYNSREQLAQLAADEQQSDINYQQGIATGYQRDETRLANAQEAYQILQNMSAAGISVGQDALEQVKTDLMQAQNLISYRNAGYLFDVVSNSGVIQPVTLDGRDPFTGKEVDYKNYPIQLNPTTGYYEILDPSTQEKMTKYTDEQGKTVSLLTLTEKAAKDISDKMGVSTFNVVFPGENGMATQKSLSYDASTGVFYEAGNPANVFLKIPQSSQEYNTSVLKNVPADWRTNEAVKAQITEKVNLYVNKPSNADIADMGLKSLTTPEEGQVSGQQKPVKSFFDMVTNVGEANQEFGEEIVKGTGQVLKGVGEKVAPAVKKVGDFASDIYGKVSPGVKSTVKNIFTPSTSSSPIGLNTPANLGFDFKMPEFNFSGFGSPASAPKYNESMPATGINLPKVDFLGGVKRLTSNISQQAGSVLSGIGTGISNLWKSTAGRLF